MLTDSPVPITRSLLLRVARDIHDQVTAVAAQPAPVTFPDAAWEWLQHLRRQAEKARRHGWIVAATEVEWSIRSAARQLIGQLQESFAHDDLSLTRRQQCSSMHDIYRDLANLEAEFDEVRIDRRHRMLTVRTEHIELEGLDFGPFDIVLNWGDLGRGGSPYEVMAMQPLKCAQDESVTHPHVRDDTLCAGDGKVPIGGALARGNLFEFFVLVRQVLRTYSPGSAFQLIRGWFDDDAVSECSDCGCCLDEDSQYSCDRCDSTTCSECSDICHVCEGMYCRQCTDVCAECEEYVCLACSEVNADRTARRCRDCIEEETETKPASSEENHDESKTEEMETAAADPDAAVPAGCVEQVALSA